LPDLQFLTADQMSLVTPFSLNGWTVPLTRSGARIQLTYSIQIKVQFFINFDDLQPFLTKYIFQRPSRWDQDPDPQKIAPRIRIDNSG
jgi:hypothetical protein